MKETPVNKIMENTLQKMREMVDVSTIIGEPMKTGDTTLIPVSKVSYGFTSGGTDLPPSRMQSCSAVAAAAESPFPRSLSSLFRAKR